MPIHINTTHQCYFGVVTIQPFPFSGVRCSIVNHKTLKECEAFSTPAGVALISPTHLAWAVHRLMVWLGIWLVE